VLTDPERIEDHARRAKLWLLKNLKTNPALASLKPLLESARCYSRDEFVLRCSLRLRLQPRQRLCSGARRSFSVLR
jgi:hypothetical protein